MQRRSSRGGKGSGRPPPNVPPEGAKSTFAPAMSSLGKNGDFQKFLGNIRRGAELDFAPLVGHCAPPYRIEKNCQYEMG